MEPELSLAPSESSHTRPRLMPASFVHFSTTLMKKCLREKEVAINWKRKVRNGSANFMYEKIQSAAFRVFCGGRCEIWVTADLCGQWCWCSVEKGFNIFCVYQMTRFFRHMIFERVGKFRTIFPPWQIRHWIFDARPIKERSVYACNRNFFHRVFSWVVLKRGNLSTFRGGTKFTSPEPLKTGIMRPYSKRGGLYAVASPLYIYIRRDFGD